MTWKVVPRETNCDVKTKLETTECRRCGESFEFERRGERGKDYCPTCRKAVDAQCSKAWRERNYSKPAGQLAGISLEMVSKTVGVPMSTVVSVERRCLASLRNDPLLRRLYRDWVAAGMPRPEPEDFGEQLLKHLAAVVAWYERVQALMETYGTCGTETAAEIEDQIENFHRMIGKELKRAHGVTE